MKRLCIIPCGKKKIWDVQPDTGPVRAEDAYLSPFHQACERYAENIFDEWVFCRRSTDSFAQMISYRKITM